MAARACRLQPPRLASAPAARARACRSGRPHTPHPGKTPPRARAGHAREPQAARPHPDVDFTPLPPVRPQHPESHVVPVPHARGGRRRSLIGYRRRCLRRAAISALTAVTAGQGPAPRHGASPAMGVSRSGWSSSGGYPATTALHPSLPGQSRKPDATGVTDWCPSQSSPGPRLKPLRLGLCF